MWKCIPWDVHFMQFCSYIFLYWYGRRMENDDYKNNHELFYHLCFSITMCVCLFLHISNTWFKKEYKSLICCGFLCVAQLTFSLYKMQRSHLKLVPLFKLAHAVPKLCSGKNLYIVNILGNAKNRNNRRRQKK